jgi:hypothetical protein
MTLARRLIWVCAMMTFAAAYFAVMVAAFAWGRDWDWGAFFQSPARVGLLVVSLALTMAAAFSGFGGMNPGKREDRRNRWIFGPLAVLTLGLVVLPPYLDARNLWTLDEAVTPYVGLALVALGGGLRIAPVLVLGRRFTGLVAIPGGPPARHRRPLSVHPPPQLRGHAGLGGGVRARLPLLARPAARGGHGPRAGRADERRGSVA